MFGRAGADAFGGGRAKETDANRLTGGEQAGEMREVSHAQGLLFGWGCVGRALPRAPQRDAIPLIPV
ncbi:hypothetical protein AOE01nite_10100 [Acetobacter oeni]|uniref:Uncharacterized protein n=1 Tax=Acetobacter oeni TaxID=304077 RepID=A0A511XIM0_9PROT|nr:hypothetical protein AOE01nite_10100 [Acetobacter oeni]